MCCSVVHLRSVKIVSSFVCSIHVKYTCVLCSIQYTHVCVVYQVVGRHGSLDFSCHTGPLSSCFAACHVKCDDGDEWWRGQRIQHRWLGVFESSGQTLKMWCAASSGYQRIDVAFKWVPLKSPEQCSPLYTSVYLYLWCAAQNCCI